ncbi:integral membrane protein MviN [Magnetococcus marinus MC-1]|uniref:Probable lipid II flippase MurJ n=1 Tax=Magnetococcus marinus (strain ATCC BAA-1437 / JCM 17883 / MC-1) TaxID=156889 RepID=A0LD68_MAGMM|nr:integral membrane protein MviN [Magnetococcus marinus MC-1]
MPVSLPSSAHNQRRGLLRAVGTISFYTLLSRILGFIRDIVIARGFGAGMGADAFFVALKLPNFLRRLFAEGAFSTAFVPVFADYLAAGDTQQTQRAAQAIFTQLLLVLMVIVALAQLFMPWLIMAAAPGFLDQPDKYQLTVDLTRITFPYILFISLVALAGGILNSHQRFAVPAATPMLLNLSLIGAALFLTPYVERPAEALAWGVFLGGAAQLLVQWPALKQIGFTVRLRWEPKHSAIGRILRLMGPSILGVSVAQVNLLFDILLASFLSSGAISYLYYADRLVEFPLGLIGIAMGTAILPALSAHAAKNDDAALNHDLDFALRLIFLINLPAMVGLIMLREPILALLFERGAFGSETTHLTGNALFAYAMGLMAFASVKVLAPAFYARKDTKTPVRIAIICMITNMFLNVILMFPLGYVGLALATTLSSYLNMLLLLRALKKRTGFKPHGGFFKVLLKGTLATMMMAAGIWAMHGHVWPHGGDVTTTQRAVALLPTIGVGVALFLLTAWLLKLEELQMLVGLLKRKK